MTESTEKMKEHCPVLYGIWAPDEQRWDMARSLGHC